MVDELEALAALAAVGLEARRAAPIVGGWAFFTFDVNGEWIARFARDADVARSARRELALLPRLAQHMSLAVPMPTHHGVHAGLPFFAYRRIAGRGMEPADATPALLHGVARMLAELHAFPVHEAALLLDVGPPERAWRAHFDRLRPIIESTALPVMDDRLAERVRVEFDRLLAAIEGVEPCLVHNDLGLEHLLVEGDGDGSGPTLHGVIDFESAWIGDPAIDLVGIDLALGPAASAAVARGRDLGPNVAERIWHYRWMGSVHAVIHAMRIGDDALLAGALAELRARIEV